MKVIGVLLVQTKFWNLRTEVEDEVWWNICVWEDTCAACTHAHCRVSQLIADWLLVRGTEAAEMHLNMMVKLSVPVRPGPGWIRPCCCCWSCLVGANAPSANFFFSAASETLRVDWDQCSCCHLCCPAWCWQTCAAELHGLLQMQTLQTMTIVWQSCPFWFLMELSVQHCCCCLTIRGSTHPLHSTSSLHLSREVVGSGPWPPWTPRSILADETQTYPVECWWRDSFGTHHIGLLGTSHIADHRSRRKAGIRTIRCTSSHQDSTDHNACHT